MRSKITMENLLTSFGVCDELIMFDTETTGLSSEKNHIIQLSAIKYNIGVNNELSEIGRLDVYINPEYSLPTRITEITGITDEQLINERTEAEVFPEIRDFFAGAQILGGYNVKFDIGFLNAMFARNGETLEYDFLIDILEMARDIVQKGDVENHKLGTIAHFYSLDYDLTFHNSMDDIIATSRLLKVFLKEYEEMKTKLDAMPKVPKKVARVFSLSYWPGYRGNSRIYINTNLGGFFYDIRKKEWDLKPDNPESWDTVDLERLIEDAFKLAGATDEAEFARYRG